MAYIGNQGSVAGFVNQPSKQDLTGASGGTLTLTHAVSGPEDISLFINNVRQEPTESYTAVGTTVTLQGYTVAATDDIYVLYNGLTQLTSTVADGSVSMAKLASTGTLPALDGSALTGLAVSNRNLIINGAMKVAQRGTSSTGLGASSGYFTVDRFRMNFNTSGRLTMTQEAITDLPGFANAIKLACTTADTSIASGENVLLQTRLEGQDLQQLEKGTSGAKPITLSFYVKGNAAATYTAEIRDQDNTRYNGQEFSVTTSWNRVSLTYVGDTTGAYDDDNANSLTLGFFLHAGSAYTGGTFASNTWQTTTDKRVGDNQTSFFDSTDRTFFITGLQMEIGSGPATAFEHRSYGDELARCQRYLYMLDTTSSAGDENTPVFREGATAAQLTYYLPTNLRATPSIVGSNYGRVVGYNTSFSVAAASVSAMAVRTNINDGQKIDINLTHASLAGSYVFVHHDRSGESGTLYFEAEL